MGSYFITEKLSGSSNKFCCMVSFNGNPVERYEVEVPNDMGTIEVIQEDGSVVEEKIQIPDFDNHFIDGVLQKVADDLENEMAAASVTPIVSDDEVQIVDGKIHLG